MRTWRERVCDADEQLTLRGASEPRAVNGSPEQSPNHAAFAATVQQFRSGVLVPTWRASGNRSELSPPEGHSERESTGGGSRTRNLQIRSLALYPIELRPRRLRG